jgi:hypothetical protein
LAFEPEDTAAGFTEFRADRAHLGFDQVLHDGQTEAVAPLAIGGLGFSQAFSMKSIPRSRSATPGPGSRTSTRPRPPRSWSQSHPSTEQRELEGVAREIRERLIRQRRIAAREQQDPGGFR